MGLFDKKKKSKDDFDSPVEQIDLSAPSTASGSLPKDDDDYEEVVASTAPAASAAKAASQPLKAQPAATAAPAAAAAPAKKVATTGYGIDDAISLMRTLPSDNVELVVQVVKHTLESAHIDIATIIDDATGKVDRIESRVTVLRSAIADLEREIQTRRDEIDKLEADRRETTRVKERLLLAQKLTTEKRERPGSNSSYPTPQPMAGPGPTAAAAEISGPLPGLGVGRTPPRTTGEVSASRERPVTMQPPTGASTDTTAPKK